MNNTVIENVAEHRFELPMPDGSLAGIYYRLDEQGRLVLFHTDVPAEFSGLGFGTQLAVGTFEAIRATGRKAVIRCPFLQTFLVRHREFDDLVVG